MVTQIALGFKAFIAQVTFHFLFYWLKKNLKFDEKEIIL